jgi:hypothetical protein
MILLEAQVFKILAAIFLLFLILKILEKITIPFIVPRIIEMIPLEKDPDFRIVAVQKWHRDGLVLKLSFTVKYTKLPVSRCALVSLITLLSLASLLLASY